MCDTDCPGLHHSVLALSPLDPFALGRAGTEMISSMVGEALVTTYCRSQ